MNASFKKISTDFTSFRKLINEDYIYVDKTGLLRELIEGSSKNIFLSRPRRFGKSLVLNTILEIFSGDQDLFKGLQIEQSGYDFPKYPVLKLDMSIPCSSPEELRLEIFNALTNLATKNGLTLKSTSYGAALKELIEKTRDVHNKDVVVLIDEYDYPVSSKINNKTKANNNSEVLADFYASFKSVNDLLRFALVTGVTRNSMMGISAGLNNLDDISLDKKYAAICGFTPEEIDRYFADRYPAILQTLRKNNYSSKIEGRGVLSSLSDLKEETLHWYDGYSWDGRTKVLNPISVLKFIDTHTFKSYWALTSTSSQFLSNVLKEASFDFTFNNLESVPLRDLVRLTPDNVKPVTVLFQTGYLTIAKENFDQYFSLKIPNYEIYDEIYGGFPEFIFNLLVKNADKEKKAIELDNAFLTRDAKTLSDTLRGVLAGVPAGLHPPNFKSLDNELKTSWNENYYNTIFLIYFRGLTIDVRPEEPGSIGNPDLTLFLKDQTKALIETKYQKDVRQKDVPLTLNKRANDALKTIIDKKYGQQYRLQGDKVVTVGLGVVNRGDVLAIFGDEPV